MKIREVMTSNPICCLSTDSAQKVANILRNENVGSVPVIDDQQTKKLVGMITDRDLCCGVVAEGLDPKSTTIERFVTPDPISCRDGENLEKAERAMQEHQVRRIPIVDAEGHCIGIVSQADLALKEKPEKVHKTVSEISKPEAPSSIAA
jgi:CBS domain-containing protein